MHQYELDKFISPEMIYMQKKMTLAILLFSPLFSFASMPEAECHALQSEIYKYANSANSQDIEEVKKLYQLSTKLTEECGYLMDKDVLEQRRAYNYVLYKKINGE